MMNKCKLYRYDDNLGLIALYELKYKTTLNSNQKEGLIKTVVANIKENGNALLYCALQYLEMQKPEEAYKLLSSCLNDPKVTAKNEIVKFDLDSDGTYEYVMYAGGRSETSLSVGKIDGWYKVTSNGVKTHSITRNADGTFTLTPVEQN